MEPLGQATPGDLPHVELVGRWMYNRTRMNTSRNTRQRFCLALIVSLLFCGLSSIEVPEFVQLIDDTSNDFTVSVSPPAAESATVDQTSNSATGAIQRCDHRAAFESQASGSIRPAHSDEGYLQRICIHRT